MREKEPSNHTAPSLSGKQTLPKAMILNGKRNFVSLFSHSRTLSAPHLILKYRFVTEPPSEYRVAFIAPKKTGNAVHRNRIKRLLREAFRTQFREILPDPSTIDRGVHMAFIGLNANVSHRILFAEVNLLLSDLFDRMQAAPIFNPDNS